MGSESAFGIRPDSDRRLAEAMLYVARRLAETADPYRGAVKLNKVLWRADFESFRIRGQSVTGTEYRRLPEGPAPVRLRPVRRALEDDGAAHVETVDVGAPRPETVLVADRGPDPGVLSAEEVASLDEAVAFFHGKTGKQCSELSHRLSSGWQAVQDGEVIPYSTAIVRPGPIDFPPRTTERVAKLLRDHEASLASDG